MGSQPEAQEAVTPQSQMTEEEKALKSKLTGISSQYSDILSKQYPGYEQYAQSGLDALQGRISTGKQFEDQAASTLPTVNTLSPEFQKQLDNTIGVKKQQAQTTLQDIYNPIEKQTTSNIYARLGGMNSSIARDILGRLEQEKTKQATSLTQAIEADRNTIEQQQLANQQAYLQQLLGGSDYYRNLALSGLTGASDGGSSIMGTGLNGTTSINNNAINLANAINAANQQNYQNAMTGYKSSWYNPSNLMNTGSSNASSAALLAAYLSDIRTKKNIKYIGKHKDIKFYEFEYKPEFNQPKGKHTGVMAQEVEHIPNIVTNINGIKYVNYVNLFKQLKGVA